MQTTGQHQHIKVDNLTICYEDYGQGETPVIFIHGFPFDKSSWQPQLEFLKSSYRVIAYDVRGFCKSTPEDMKASVDLFAKDLISLMDALHIRRAIPCGISMGGYIALNAIQHYPDRFSALVLCNTQAIADSAEGKEKRYKTIEEIEKNGLNEFASSFVEKTFSANSHSNKKEMVEHMKNTILSTPIANIARTLSALAQRLETTSALPGIKVPTLIISSSNDTLIAPQQSELMHEKIHNSHYHIIKDAGHISNLDQPAEFNRVLKDFLDRLE